MRAIKKVGVFDSGETVAAKISLAEMVIDNYQGHLNKQLVAKMVAKWDESAAGAVILNLREDNTYAVLDGQHRVIAARQVGIQALNALVYIGKTKEEEAGLFVKLNDKHNVSSIDRFRANLMSGAVREKTIRAAVREVGLEIPFQHPTRTLDRILCVGALVTIYENFGLPHLKLVLGVLTSAFNAYSDRTRGYSQTTVIGTAQFLYRYPQINVPRLIERMKAKTPTTLIAMGDAKLDAHADLWTGWMKMLVSLYNVGVGVRNKTAYLPAGPAESKRMTPKTLASFYSAENKAKRQASVVKAHTAALEGWTDEKRQVARERMIKFNKARATNKRKAVRGVEMTVGNKRPLTASLAAAKTSKRR